MSIEDLDRLYRPEVKGDPTETSYIEESIYASFVMGGFGAFGNLVIYLASVYDGNPINRYGIFSLVGGLAACASYKMMNTMVEDDCIKRIKGGKI